MVLFVLFKKGVKYLSMAPLPTPPIQCCTAGLKVCGHSEMTQQCQGGRGGGTLCQGSSNTPFRKVSRQFCRQLKLHSLVYKQQHVYFGMSNDYELIQLLGLITISCNIRVRP